MLLFIKLLLYFTNLWISIIIKKSYCLLQKITLFFNKIEIYLKIIFKNLNKFIFNITFNIRFINMHFFWKLAVIVIIIL